MSFLRRPRTGRPGLLLGLVCIAAALAACGTRSDDSLGLGLIGDRDEQKAVRFVLATADTSVSFQSTAPQADIPFANTLLVSARTGYLVRSLSRFPSSGLPPAGTVIDSASVEWPWREGFGTSPFSLDVHRVTSAWSETAIAADSFPPYDAVPAVSLEIPFGDPVLDTLSMSLTALVQGWVADTTSNFGLALVAAPGEEGELELDARESTTSPRLTVHWTVAGRDTSVSTTPAADTWVLGTTAAFIPLPNEPRRLTVSRGLPTRSLLHFTWTDLGPRATVHRAEMTLHVDAAASSGRAIPIGARSVLAQPWQGFDTGTDAELHGLTTIAATVDSVVLDLTELIAELAAADNHGFQLRATDERVDTDYFRVHAHDTEVAGKAPSLRIWYTPGDVPEATP